ncbi:MAG: hypothetical protein PHU65_02205 [Actinomycetota bacterium]|nr:hypothetical protein [Actinomycetota bacterium]
MADSFLKSFKNIIKKSKNGFIINAENIAYKDLNRIIRELVKNDKDHTYFSEDSGRSEIIEIQKVLGQRYIGDGIQENIKIVLKGTPGNDLAAFMDGPQIEIFGNAQDASGNTMNSGKIIIHGNAGDITGYSMRGGEIYVRNDVGYRSGIHMKSYREKFPVIVIGGRAGDFLGEYMAGGIVIVLGLNTNDFCRSNSFIFKKNEAVGNFVGTGMHGGVIYIYGDIFENKLGKEIIKSELEGSDKAVLEKYISNYFNYFSLHYNLDYNKFIKLEPYSKRPYGNLYAY